MHTIRLLEHITQNNWKWIAIGCFFFLFVLIGYMFILKETYRQYQHITGRLVAVKQDIKFKNNQFIALQRDLNSYRSFNQSSLSSIRTTTLDETVNNMLKICSSMNVDVDSYRCLSDQKHAFYIERSMSIVLQATMVQLMKLFNQIKIRNLPISFHDFIVSPIDSHSMKDGVTLSVTMKAYQLRPSQHQLLKPALVLRGGDVNPSLEQSSLDALYFVGVLSQDKTIWALIKKPDGSIAWVRQGDFIGRERAKIILITQAFVRIQENAPGDAHSIKKIETLHLKQRSVVCT